MGNFDIAHFDAGGARHDIVVTGRHRGDLDRLAHDLRAICQAQIDLFDGVRGWSRAVRPLHVPDIGRRRRHVRRAGTQASTSLLIPRDGLPQPGATEISDAYRSMLGVASHEYFHAWNVKRIKPAAFTPYDLTRENYTEQLWMFEGFTSYYDDLMLLRSGVIGTESYLELLGRAITRHLRTPARNVQSVAASSFDAWTKYYRQDENAPNAVVSYYVKGSLVALALDLTLRRDGKSTLDDVMRAAWVRFGKTGIGVPERGIEALAQRSIRARSDAILRRVRARHGRTAFGRFARPVRHCPRAAAGRRPERQGRQSREGRRKARGTRRSRIGCRHAREARVSGWPRVRCRPGGKRHLVAVDGIRASPEQLERALKSRSAGDGVRTARVPAGRTDDRGADLAR